MAKNWTATRFIRSIKILAGDRGYRGKKQSGRTMIEIPGTPKATDSPYQKRKKHRRFCKRAGIEPVIGHLKSDNRLGRNFYKGLFGDSINVMLAAAAFNFRRAMRALFVAVLRIMRMLFHAAKYLYEHISSNCRPLAMPAFRTSDIVLS